MRITEVSTEITSFNYSGETYINLKELSDLLKKDCHLEMEECLIMPYYICNKKRMELYQYEFCCLKECDFENYILKVTGKEKIEDISNWILALRKKCFATCDEAEGLQEYLEFVLNCDMLKEEIEKIFGSYSAENIFAVVY